MIHIDSDIDDVLSRYKQKIWGKDEDGQYNGFSMRGKQGFKKVIEYMLENLKKGVSKEFNEIEFKVLDTRKKGVGSDFEIEMKVKGSREVAFLTLFGPNVKKDNVIMITKSKDSESKCVKILTEQFIKPFAKEIILGEFNESTVEEKQESPIVNEGNLLKCQYCEKTSYSSPGLKGRITKMHQENMKNKEYKENKTPRKTHIIEEANKVVNLLLNEIIEISDSEDIVEQANLVNLEEACEEDINHVKRIKKQM